MTHRRSAPTQEAPPSSTARTGHDFPPDLPPAARGRLERKRLTDWRKQIVERDAAVGVQLWESLAQKMVGLSYLAEAMAERLMLEDPAESQRAKHIAQLACDAVAEACQLARTLAPKVSPHSPK